MALLTYADLTNAINDWAAGSGDATIAARADDFVSLFEDYLRRELRVRQMETVNAAYALAAEYNALPTDFLEARELKLNSNPALKLQYMTPHQIDERYAGSSNGQPKVFTIQNNQIRVAPVPSGSYTATLTYYQTIPALSGSVNWVYQSYRDLYLAGSLHEAAKFVKAWEEAAAWASARDQIIAKMITEDKNARWSGDNLTQRPLSATY